ncbi:MAG: flavodoxin family protein [Syntrophaceae bacterium]|nr:flavodoxin family protein [Syntrophaceae bacterium]
MKITIFNGSPRGGKSNTHVLTEAFREGAESAGAEVENFFLIDKKINHCRGCFSCWYKTPGKCVYNDDMTELLEAWKNSDIVCYATPVYSWDLTACLKNFVDRLIPLKSPSVVEEEGNYDMRNTMKKNPDVVIISNAGFPGENNFRTIRTVMSAANPILEIYRNCGMLLRSPGEGIIEKVEEYLAFIRRAGAALAIGAPLSDEVREGLEMELLPVNDYLAYISGR